VRSAKSESHYNSGKLVSKECSKQYDMCGPHRLDTMSDLENRLVTSYYGMDDLASIQLPVEVVWPTDSISQS
jgi:hypothetical protein